MLAAQRQSLIVDEVNRLGAVRIADLAAAGRLRSYRLRSYRRAASGGAVKSSAGPSGMMRLGFRKSWVV